MLMTYAKDFAPVNFIVWKTLLHPIDNALDSLPQPSASGSPIALEETDECYVISLDVPGVQREDLTVEWLGGRMQVSGVRHGSRGARRFHHTFPLPSGVQAEDVAADLRDGVLHLSIPKPASAKPMKIRIGEGSSKPNFLKNLFGDKPGKESVESNKVPVTVAG